jgi:glycosyltransferase involved in cell wall biosynthesis
MRSECTVERIGVVLPARNEQAHLGECLCALDSAVGDVDVPVSVVVVLDCCTDKSAEVVEDVGRRLWMKIGVLTSHAGAVGAARAQGASYLLAHLGTPGTWLATTDADSVVPRNWLSALVKKAQDGAQIIAGTVAVDDWSERSPSVRLRYEAAYGEPLAPDGHGHIHGANLALKAELYNALGGFGSLASDEDVALIGTARQRGVAITWAGDIAVRTSARMLGRAPDGFAGYLNCLELADRAVQCAAATGS